MRNTSLYISLQLPLLGCVLFLGSGFGEPENSTTCWKDSQTTFADYLQCRAARSKRQCDAADPFGPCAEPCANYVMISQPERRVSNKIDRLTDSALCDRTLHRRWYRFESEAGGKIPEHCVDEYSCGTHVPIWLNGDHPRRRGELRDVEVCASRGGECCDSRWYIRIANCGDFFTYLLHETRGCYQAYCVGHELPCPPGQSSPTGFSPGCTGDFPVLTGEVTLRVGQEGEFVAFYCDYEGMIPQGVNVEAQWFVKGDMDTGEIPVYRDYLRGRPRSILTEGHWARKIGSTVSCVMKGHWADGSGAPSPALRSTEYFAGIRVNHRTLNVSESEEEMEIEIQSTLPVLCLPQFSDICKLSVQVAHDGSYMAKRCVDGNMRQIVFGDCSVDMTPDNWQEPRKVKVKAVRDFYNDGTKRMLVDFRPIYTTYLSGFWNNYEIPPIEVLSSDVETAMCSSTGDPHLMTFDGLYYHVYLEGEFVLYKHKSLPLQINIRLERCGQTVTCNCAIAVKAGDDVIVVDRCERRVRNEAFGAQFPDGWRTLHRHALEQGRDWIHGLHLYEYDGGKRFTVHLPTGAYIDFQIGERDWVNLYMFASSDDMQKTMGLCGTFDKDKANDFQLNDGFTQVPAREQAACGADPDVCRFAESWRVNEEDSFFGEEVQVDLESYNFAAQQQRYCKCEVDPDTREPVVTCNYNYDTDNCHARTEQQKGVERTEELLVRHRVRRSAEPHDEDDDYFRTVFVYDQDYQGQEPSWPTPSGISEAYAQRHCQQFILEAPLYTVCRDYIEPRLSALIQECAIDIKVNDDLTWAQSTLDSVASECVDAVHQDARLWGVDPNDLGAPSVQDTQYVLNPTTTSATATTTTTAPVTDAPTTPMPSLATRMLDSICPSACSRQGQCIAGRCHCQQGFAGDDCSQNLTRPPVIHHLSGGGLCDVSVKACRQLRVYGSRFRNTTGLSCILQEIQFSGGRLSSTLPPVTLPAIFDTFEEVICPLPPSMTVYEHTHHDGPYRAYDVRVANGDGLTTPSLVWIVYHSACRHCVNDGMDSHCFRQAGSCEIGGQCFAAGETNPDNCCESCQPSLSEDQFLPSIENQRPRLVPWRSNYEVAKGSEWEITIRASDAEGCDVTVSAKSDSPHLSATQETSSSVRLRLSTARIGQYKARVTATDECGASYTQNYHVMVTRK